LLIKLPDVLNGEALNHIGFLLNDADWQDGRNTAGTQAALVKNNQQLAEGDTALKQIRAIILKVLQQDPLFFSATLPKQILPPFINRYSGQNNSYGFHVDNAMRSMPEGSGYVRADVSATLFLNSPESYEGGELVIEDTFGRQSVKLSAGDMVIYPSSSLHAVMPVTKGERVASFMFIQSMIRDPAQRRTLFDLDMSLVKLRQQLGETDEVIKLTGIYHNLLRGWSE
jgi:PKHD-type hydroxylase